MASSTVADLIDTVADNGVTPGPPGGAASGDRLFRRLAVAHLPILGLWVPIVLPFSRPIFGIRHLRSAAIRHWRYTPSSGS